MNPAGTYNAISRYSGVRPSTICDIKARCLQYTGCANRSTSQVLDFDGAALTYQKEANVKDTPSTVDAVAIDNRETLLILVEKKTWGKFFQHLHTSDKETQAKKAQEQVKEYNLNKKYTETRTICEHITGEKDLFLTLPHVFVFLTEFSDKGPIENFASMLAALAHTSSTIDYTIQKAVVEGMKGHLTSTVSCRHSRYLNCMELDKYIINPSSFD